MGCDIHSHAERRVNGRWEKVPDFEPFDWRSSTMFGFLAGVRSWIDPIDDPRGFPVDASEEVAANYRDEGYKHTPSFLTAKELLEFNYDKPVFEGAEETYRDNLSDIFFVDLVKLTMLGNPEDVRIVFWFDN